MPPRTLAVAPGKEDGAAAARQHVARSLTSDQKPAVAGQFPGLEEQLFGGVQQRLVDVRTGIVEADLDRPDDLFDLGKQVLNLGFLTGIDAERVGLEARSLQLSDQPWDLAASRRQMQTGIAALGKTPGHGRANGVACADKYCYAAAFRHPFPLLSSYLIR